MKADNLTADQAAPREAKLARKIREQAVIRSLRGKIHFAKDYDLMKMRISRMEGHDIRMTVDRSNAYDELKKTRRRERTASVIILMTKAEKIRLTQKATRANMSLEELFRRATEQYVPPDERELLERLAIETSSATKRAIHSINQTIKFVAASERRMRAREEEHRRNMQKRRLNIPSKTRC